jgi:leucyl-tRNA synthetase
MEFDFRRIEEEYRKYWIENEVYTVTEDSTKPKYYVLDMFPYPSGAGLHVGHPLGYVASDIFSRYKRMKGFNVLHPMGFDAFGLPAEQYAIETGTHPQVTTDKAIATYKEQLAKIGFSYDWTREVKTCDPDYYKWTQWIFLQLFDSWYNKENNKAEKIETLVARFDKENRTIDVDGQLKQWNLLTEDEKQMQLMHYRLAFQSYTEVNWCEALGCVLANDEVKDGKSERGGFPIERRKMKQWSLRITAYADRLLEGLENLEWSESMKEMQRNWIGRSEGALIDFKVKDREDFIKVFTTRADTIFGATFLVLSPEHELVEQLVTAEQKSTIDEYVAYVKSRSDVERQQEKKSNRCVYRSLCFESVQRHAYSYLHCRICVSRLWNRRYYGGAG